ncbi:hypothetical protein H6F75_25235 [Nodosilinea sp. FACHB-131]|uniref:hypothetical protein n=1 Tax=Cyanophyceae TaxID=3028117 RepID=UPI00168429E6|nr:hypothetical protein [Nodosilinea sp. FACHB-131]MBD1876794.1 hypothetical protein [Nodosilinea sp. FACHB-131]
MPNVQFPCAPLLLRLNALVQRRNTSVQLHNSFDRMVTPSLSSRRAFLEQRNPLLL